MSYLNPTNSISVTYVKVTVWDYTMTHGIEKSYCVLACFANCIMDISNPNLDMDLQLCTNLSSDSLVEYTVSPNVTESCSSCRIHMKEV